MTIKEIYNLALQMGIDSDFRGRAGVEKFLENKRKIYNETRLIKSGGCCWEWAEYYGNYFKEKGYYTKQVIISTRNETNKKTHQFVVVSKNKTYCVIDQTKYWCRNFKK